MSEPNWPSLSDAEERRRRQDVLHNLAQRNIGAPPASLPPTPLAASRSPAPDGGRPRWLLPVGAVLVVLLIAGGVLFQHGALPGLPGRTHSAPTTVVIAPSLQGLECPHAVAWSPSGQEIAVVGYQVICPDDDPGEFNYQAGLVNIYSAVTGKLIQTISPDATVLALPGIPLPSPQVDPTTSASDTSMPVINYTHVLWSPSGTQLALTFFIDHWVFNPFKHIPGETGFDLLPGVGGLVLMNVNGSDERAALYTGLNLVPGTPTGSQTSMNYAATEWDTTTLKAVPVPAQPRYGDLVSLPVAPTYSWSSSGQAVPGSAASGSPSPRVGIGDPDGGSTFSMWQPGLVALYTSAVVNNSPVTVTPGVYAWSSSFVAWSPDGRYLIDAVSLVGTMHPAGDPIPSAAGLQTFGWERLATIGIRDQAMQRLLAALRPSGKQNVQPLDYLAWNPTGGVLAALPELPEGSRGSLDNGVSGTVTLYDSATGRTLGTVRTRLNAGVTSNDLSDDTYLGSTSDLLWSTDGSHLLAYYDLSDTITIWGPGALPKA